jgi:outer membrane protein assembly factor BamA
MIYDSLKAEQTSDDLRNIQLRGYRSATVNYEAKTEKKVTKVLYQVNPGPRIFLDTILIIAEDSMLQEIVDKTKDNILIPAESALDIQLYNQERVRIVRLLQNEGYATFNETYVSPMEVDTAGNRVKGIIRLLNPSDSTFHSDLCSRRYQSLSGL